MGKVIAVWSATKKTGKSLFLYMLASQISSILNDDRQILVGCLNFSYGNLMNLFGVDKSELNFEDIVNFKIHPDNEFNLTNALARKKNIYLLGSKKTSSTYANRNMRIYENLIEELKHTFDLVIFDTMSGNENSLTNMVLEKSDYVLNVINQDKEILDRYPFITNKDLAYIVNRYRDIYPSVKELSSVYGLENAIKLPLCDVLQEMKNKDKLEFYDQMDTEYNKSVRDLSFYLADKLKLELKQEPVHERRKKGLFAGRLGGRYEFNH